MNKNRKYRYKKRQFLNEDEDMRAYIIGVVRKSEDNDTYTDIQLEIADCTRQINLDFDFHNELESIKKAEKKITLFRQIMNEFADAVEEEITLFLAKPRKPKSRKRKPAKVEILEVEI